VGDGGLQFLRVEESELKAANKAYNNGDSVLISASTPMFPYTGGQAAYKAKMKKKGSWFYGGHVAAFLGDLSITDPEGFWKFADDDNTYIFSFYCWKRIYTSYSMKRAHLRISCGDLFMRGLRHGANRFFSCPT